MGENRLIAVTEITDVVLRLNERLGPSANVEIIQAMALVLCSIASKQGQLSMDCPTERIKEEAEAVMVMLSDAFQ